LGKRDPEAVEFAVAVAIAVSREMQVGDRARLGPGAGCDAELPPVLRPVSRSRRRVRRAIGLQALAPTEEEMVTARMRRLAAACAVGPYFVFAVVARTVPAQDAEIASPVAYCVKVGDDDQTRKLPPSLIPEARRLFTGLTSPTTIRPFRR